MIAYSSKSCNQVLIFVYHDLIVLILLHDKNFCDYRIIIQFFNHWFVPFIIDSVLQISMDFTDDSFTMDFRLLSEGFIGSVGEVWYCGPLKIEVQ